MFQQIADTVTIRSLFIEVQLMCNTAEVTSVQCNDSEFLKVILHL